MSNPVRIVSTVRHNRLISSVLNYRSDVSMQSFRPIHGASFFTSSAASSSSKNLPDNMERRPRNKQQDVWNSKLEEFKYFVKENGHGRVPQSHKTLGYWVNHNRRRYKSGNLAEDRVAALEQAGFVWNVDEAAWMEHYQDMCNFHREYGHCLVPREYEPLATWVRVNRYEYQKFIQKRTPCFMTSKRISLLNQIHFCWDAREATWYERLYELKEFVNVNGIGAMPPKKTHAALLYWLSYQKRLHRDKCKGKKVSLTDKRIAELKKLGFVFES